MNKIIGIDLGTTHSLVAVVDSGIPLVLADAEGRRLHPSVVHLPGPHSLPITGFPAARVRAAKPLETVYSVKRFMGRRGADLAPGELNVPYPLNATPSRPVTLPIHGRHWKPEESSAEILRALKSVAESYLGGPVNRAVVTVPAYFNDAQRQATKQAGELAGLTVERILNEPTAAAIAYGLDRLNERSKIAVYDLGGGTFDLSLLELREGVFQVLATHGDTRLGGDDIDARVAERLRGLIRDAGGPDVREDPVMTARVRDAAEDAKIKLSQTESVAVVLPFLKPNFSFQCELTRAALEGLAKDLILRTRDHCRQALADAGLATHDLQQVVLVGGQTRMPLVRRLVAEWFECPEFAEERGQVRLGNEFHTSLGPLLNTSQNPDEAVALGAAIQAEILAGGFQHLLLLDVTPLSLGLETFGGLMNVIIPRNSTIPLKAGELFTTAADFQREMLIHVLQGERERARDNWSLGKFSVEFEPAPRGVARVGVQFEIDANGILRVLARDTRTGRERLVEMSSAVDVDDAAVRQMVEESVEHAWTDMAARQWIETKQRAEETADATRKGLSEFAAELPGPIRQFIETSLEAVLRCLAEESAETQTGDARALKAALAQLDEATLPLADLMMDKALAETLQRRGTLGPRRG